MFLLHSLKMLHKSFFFFNVLRDVKCENYLHYRTYISTTNTHYKTNQKKKKTHTQKIKTHYNENQNTHYKKKKKKTKNKKQKNSREKKVTTHYQKKKKSIKRKRNYNTPLHISKAPKLLSIAACFCPNEPQCCLSLFSCHRAKDLS